MPCKLASISVYPVKAMGGNDLDQALVTTLGLEGDRRWILTDSAGTFISQRSEPSLALVNVVGDGIDLQLSAPGMPPLSVQANQDGQRQIVNIWKDTVEAAAGPESASLWFSRFLGKDCLLSYMDDSCRRPVSLPEGKSDDNVSFADAYPCLAISTASLDLLNSKLAEPVPMNRFRTNLVLSGCDPHAEDSWDRFRIGEAIFRTVSPCSRCSVPTIDQQTGQPSANQEPLRTLATYRSQPGGLMFGVNLVVEKEGLITVGDPLEIL
jgi:MOSC domain-containing protein